MEQKWKKYPKEYPEKNTRKYPIFFFGFSQMDVAYVIKYERTQQSSLSVTGNTIHKDDHKMKRAIKNKIRPCMSSNPKMEIQPDIHFRK